MLLYWVEVAGKGTGCYCQFHRRSFKSFQPAQLLTSNGGSKNSNVAIKVLGGALKGSTIFGEMVF